MEDREGEINEEERHSKKSSPILAIIILLVICLVGAIAIFYVATAILGGIQTDFSDNQSTYKLENSTDKIGRHEFKIPEGYEKQEMKNEAGGGLTVSFMNKDIKFLYISNLNKRVNLENFAKEYGKELGNEGVKLTINGEPAYRFEINSMGYSFYSYVMNIDGDTYTFLINKDTPNPDDFIAKLLPSD